MDTAQVSAWIAGYERAWRTAGTDGLASLFAADATYSQGPYEETVCGLAAIARMWDAEREGPDETFELTSGIVALDGDTAVVRAAVYYGNPVAQEYRDLWIIRFDTEGRCSSFEEWPFWPERGLTTP